MIFIKNKKAWKEFVKDHPNDAVEIAVQYPCYFYIYATAIGESLFYHAIYKQDLESMIQKIDSGREF